MAVAMKGFHPLKISVVKMNKPFISLCPEVTRAHALTLMDWLEDERVTCYLSDSRHVSRSIEQAIDRTQLPILTHLFNQGGRFFMAYDRHDAPVGFVRLIKTGSNCEIVLVIGDSDKWGRNLGARTIREGMKLAFLDMRAKKLIAKIHPDNTRSVKAFLRSGFVLESETPTLKSFSMAAGRYLQLLREGTVGDSTRIYITEIDKARLESLIALEQGPTVVELEHELERAIVVKPQQVAGNVVTMNSRALVQLDVTNKKRLSRQPLTYAAYEATQEAGKGKKVVTKVRIHSKKVLTAMNKGCHKQKWGWEFKGEAGAL